MHKLTGFLILFSSPNLLQATEYHIQAKIYDNDKLIGSPALIVKANKQASIVVEGSYSLDLTLTEAEEQSLNLYTNIKYQTENYEREISPSFTLSYGNEAQFSADGKVFKFVVNNPDNKESLN